MAGMNNGKPMNGPSQPPHGQHAPGVAGRTVGGAPEGASGPKRVFTTGEAAEVCKVSQQTIIRCFDAGRLGGFRVPGSKFRRIPRMDLIKFMKGNNIPMENLARYEGSTVSAIAQDDGLTKRVLVVDDDAAILEMFKDLFSRDDRFSVKFASNGYEAGMLTESFRPHLLVLDYMLPDINGDVVCQRLRAVEHLRDTKVLFVSGVVSQTEIERLSSSGASGFVAKPFDVAALMKRVEQLVELDSDQRRVA
jgi:excisionase family DNA binding protein